MQNNHMSYGSRASRSRKYDAYIPPAAAPQQSIAAAPPIVQDIPTYAQQSSATFAVPVTPPVHNIATSSLEFIAPKQSQLPATPVQPQLRLPKKKKQLQPRRTIFSTVIKATVELEKVTRQSVKAVKHTFEPPEIVALRTKRQRMIVRSFYAFGVVSFVLAVGLGAKVIFTNSPKQRNSTGVLGLQVNPQNDATRTSEAPSEAKPTKQDFDTYLVAQPYPRYLRIPSIGVEARVRRLGLDSKNAVGSPNNIYDTGWYDGSVLPGEKDGAAVLVGHVSGPTQQGVFWSLSKLEVGASIEVEKGNGVTVKYKVKVVEKLPSGDVDMKKYIQSETPGKHDIKLLTVTGKYASIDQQYSDRTVVIAEQQ